MTTQKPNQPEGRQENFLDQVRSNIDTIIGEFEGVRDWDTDDLREHLFQYVATAVKQSFKNGIEAGKRQAERGKEKRQNPKFRKAKQAIDSAVKRQAPQGAGGQPTEDNRSWPEDRYQA